MKVVLILVILSMMLSSCLQLGEFAAMDCDHCWHAMQSGINIYLYCPSITGSTTYHDFRSLSSMPSLFTQQSGHLVSVWAHQPSVKFVECAWHLPWGSWLKKQNAWDIPSVTNQRWDTVITVCLRLPDLHLLHRINNLVKIVTSLSK